MIVQVTDENIVEAAKIHSISWQASHRSFCEKEFIEKHTAEHQKAYIREKISKGSSFFILYNPQPIAVVSVLENLIEDLYVLPDYQNKGYGSQLLNYAISIIQKQCLTPSLWILENNDAARRLYMRRGFVPSGKENSITGKLKEIEYILPKQI